MALIVPDTFLFETSFWFKKRRGYLSPPLHHSMGHYEPDCKQKLGDLTQVDLDPETEVDHGISPHGRPRPAQGIRKDVLAFFIVALLRRRRQRVDPSRRVRSL